MRAMRSEWRKRALVACCGLLVVVGGPSGAIWALPALAGPAAPVWSITATSGATNFAPGDSTGEDTYLIIATNTGGAPTTAEPITIGDNLPSGLTVDESEKFAKLRGRDQAGNGKLTCSTGPPVTCTDLQPNSPILPGEAVWMVVPVDVAANAASPLLSTITVNGGGAATASTTASSTISATPAPFGFNAGAQGFDGAATNADGSSATQAGSHPYQATLRFSLNNSFQIGQDASAQDPKDITANLPPGLVINPNATLTKCTEAQLESRGANENDGCPDSSAVGTVQVGIGLAGFPSFGSSALYNMIPPPGAPAEFAFDVGGLGIYVHLRGAVRTGSDYGVSAMSHDILQNGDSLTISTMLWGNPSDPSHDAVRGDCFGGAGSFGLCPVERLNRPLITLPSACSGPQTTSISMDSWQNPGTFVDDSFLSHDNAGDPVGITGCEKLDFSPSITLKPDTTVADSPSGLNVDLHVPQEESAAGLAEANLKNAVVTLPPGLTVNPSSANGLEACSSAQIDLHGSGPAGCPDASKIGLVEVITPLLDHPLPGSVYLAKQNDNPFNSLLAIYIAVNDPQTGVVVKLAGHVEADPSTGQLKTTFAENPQLPFSDFKLSFFGGSKAPLITPLGCGTYTTTTSLTGWNGAVVTPGDSFSIGSGCGGGFSPSFSAGTANNQAGAFSPLSVTFSRQDGEQHLGGVTVHMPPGLLGKIAGIPQCPEAPANTGTCPQASQIGSATAGAGAGSEPFFVPEAGQPANPVYLTGPYKDAPFGLSIVTHALAGPFDLGNVVVRAAINVDPTTAQLTVTSDPLPTILQGIPLDLRTINVTTDRPGFTFNPTSCTPSNVSATLTSAQGAQANVSSRFQPAGCASLPFHPIFTASTSGKTSRLNGASLNVKIGYTTGQANLRRVDLSLPIAMPSRLTTLHKACTEAQFNANPAGCPPASDIATSIAHTPLLNVPVAGPVYLVSHGGAAFPDVELVLQGEGVELIVDGKTQIKKGVTFSHFETIPDAPISSFEFNSPQGPFSLFGANGNFCTQSLVMPVTLTAQNGAVLEQNTHIEVTGCRQQISISRKTLQGSSVSVTVQTSVRGLVTITGAGIRRTTKTFGPGSHSLKVPLTATGRAARSKHHKIKIEASLTVGTKTVSKIASLKL